MFNFSMSLISKAFAPDSIFGRDRIVFGNKFPGAGYVRRSARVQLKTPFGIHLGLRCLGSSSSRWRRLSKKASPSIAFARPPLLQ
jgi:hypothetical protein